MALIGLVVGATVAIPALAEISANAEITWGVYGLDGDTETDTIASQVFAIEQVGDYVYVGGKFLEARAQSTGAAVAQPYLAAFHAETGSFAASFQPAVNGPVYALQASPDGSRLFVGGEFTSIGGDGEARGLAALDPVTGAVDTTWRAKVTDSGGAVGVVHSLTISGQQLYLAGRFNRIGGGTQPLLTTEKVGRVALSDGIADPTLSTDIDGGAVWGIAVAPDGSRIYLAGYHDTVGGDTAGADYAVLDAANGSLFASMSDIGGNSSNSGRWYGQDVVAVGDYVFWGGSEHIVRVFRASDGALVREHSTDRGGDFQDLEVVGDRVYASCHCYTNHYADYDWWTRTNPIPNNVAVTPIKYVAAYSAVTGEHLPSFALDASAARAGVWAIHGDDDGCLWIGGDVSRITTVAGNDRAAGGFAKFCPGDGGDSRAPHSPPNLTQTRSENQKLVIRWDAAYDNIGVASYEVSRDGAVIGTVASGWSAQYWFTDSNLEPATAYRYEVVSIDAAGNRSAPSGLDAATAGAVPGGDTEAPTEPGNPTQTRSELRKIVLRFDASTDNVGVDHYEVSRDGAAAGTVAATTATQHWYVDPGLEAATTYSYGVTAVDAAGNRSTTAELSAVTVGAVAEPDTEAPTGPGNPTQTRSENRKIVIRFDASTDNVGVDHYEVSRDGAAAGTVAATTATQYWYVDADLTPATSYGYEVVAIDAAGNRSTAASVTASTLGAPAGEAIAAPAGLRSTLATRERIVLNWESVTGAAGYVVQRLDGAGFTDVATISGLWHTDVQLAAGTTYTYRVLAVDSAGNRSEPSAELAVSTLP
jgi:fibronectin type 3 domain-containing protein